MKLSTKGRYGIQAVFDIAYHNPGRAAQVREIAERQSIPARFLEQVLRDLKRAEIVRSRRGPRGGYELAREAQQISVGDVIRAIEGPLTVSGDDPDESRVPGQRVIGAVCDELFDKIDACLDSVSVEELCARGDALGFCRHGERGYVYAI